MFNHIKVFRPEVIWRQVDELVCVVLPVCSVMAIKSHYIKLDSVLRLDSRISKAL